MTGHSNLVGGSSAARVIACPASIPRSADLIKVDRPSAAAEEGTALHLCMEMLLLGEAKVADFLNKNVNGVLITPELYVEKLVPAWVETEALMEKLDIDCYEAETVVSFTKDPLIGAFGTIDFAGQTTDGTPVFIDFKFGSGYQVDVTDNQQLLFYAAASLNDPQTSWLWETDPQEFIIAIVQPTFDPAVQTQTLPLGALHDFTIGLSAAIHNAHSDHPKARTGSHCKWCPAAPWCPDKLTQAEIALEISPDEQEEIAYALQLAFELEDWARKVKNNAHGMLENTTAQIPGFKLVKKRATRKWRDPAAATEHFTKSRKFKEDDYTTRSLKSPTQMEKVCKQKGVDYAEISGMVESVSSGTTLATEDDPRPAIKKAAGREIPENLQNLVNS
jgi:hypothetical protein